MRVPSRSNFYRRVASRLRLLSPLRLLWPVPLVTSIPASWFVPPFSVVLLVAFALLCFVVFMCHALPVRWLSLPFSFLSPAVVPSLVPSGLLACCGYALASALRVAPVPVRASMFCGFSAPVILLFSEFLCFLRALVEFCGPATHQSRQWVPAVLVPPQLGALSSWASRLAVLAFLPPLGFPSGYRSRLSSSAGFSRLFCLRPFGVVFAGDFPCSVSWVARRFFLLSLFLHLSLFLSSPPFARGPSCRAWVYIRHVLGSSLCVCPPLAFLCFGSAVWLLCAYRLVCSSAALTFLFRR